MPAACFSGGQANAMDLLDPEPGYYNASTYHGEKDILAIGYAFMSQNDTEAVGVNYRAWNFDVLYETTLGNGGVATIAGAYYDFVNSYDAGGLGGEQDGTSYFVEASYLTARSFNLGACASGRIAPFFRHQEFRRAGDGIGIARQNDWGFHYVMHGHNARVTYVYNSRVDSGPGPDFDRHTVGVQLQY